MKRIPESTEQYPKTLIVGVDSPVLHIVNRQSYFDEFVALVESCGIVYEQFHSIILRMIDPAYYITKGKLEELIELCQKMAIEEVIFSVPLSAQQERNLSKMLRARVFDRTQLILEIFERGAVSAEGKIQVALAMLQHRKSRLAGKGVSLSQQGGKIGTRGPGETQKEKETQHLEHLMVKLRKDLAELARTRDTQRKRRLVRGVPQICLIGYTNSGKSTILNALTKSQVYAADRLFATLDTTTRELYVDGIQRGVISDTVGFIQQLPHVLVEAFKSTLSELAYANLLIQVIDVSDTSWPQHIAVVRDILTELGVTDTDMVYVFNKADKIEITPEIEAAIAPYEPHIVMSAQEAEGIEKLKVFLRHWSEQRKKDDTSA